MSGLVRPCPRCGDTTQQRFCGVQEVLGLTIEVWNCDSEACKNGSHSYEVERHGTAYEEAKKDSDLRKRALEGE